MKTRLGLRCVAIAGCVAIMTALAAGGAGAFAGTLDQKQEIATWSQWGMGDTLAQTFRAGLSGPMVAVSVYGHGVDMPGVAAPPNAIPAVDVEIRNVSGGVPGSTILATQSVVFDAADGWQTVSFTTAATLVAGTQYAIVLALTSPVATNHWEGVCTNEYANGQALVYRDSTWWDFPTFVTQYNADPGICALDFAFRTYMSPAATQPPTTTIASTAQRDSAPPLGLVVAALAGLVAGLATIRRRVLR